MKKKIIITGVTGMVGEGVLHEALLHPDIESVLVIGRKPSGYVHQKLTEIMQADLADISNLESRLEGFDACLFCMGVSSVGMNEADYFKITHDLTLSFASTLSKINPGSTFCYVSGSGTDSSEIGRVMWARVKGKTENDLLKCGFAHVYNFRPGFMLPTPGLKNVLSGYKYLSWLYPILKPIMPNRMSTLKEQALAMINAALMGYEKEVLEVKDIIALAGKGGV